jgi:hypothetical protein
VHSEPLSFEDELSQSLRRVEAPAEFAASVLHRLADARDARDNRDDPGAPGAAALTSPPRATLPAAGSLRHRLRLAAPGSRIGWGVAAALLLMLILPLGGSLYRRQQEAQAERAAQQFALAMRLTHAALVDAGQRVSQHTHSHN